MKKKIIAKYVGNINKKLSKQHFVGLSIFIFLFAIVSIFFVTRGPTPFSSELAYIEHSVLGKDSGSVVPASCESAENHSQMQTCWEGSVITVCQTCPVPADCTGTPWGTVAHGASVTGYSVTRVDAPTSCGSVSQTRSCWNGSFSGSYPNTTCAVKSGSISVPGSCVIAAQQSTCTVSAGWTSANLSSPRFYDNNTNTTLSWAASGSQTAWVAYGGTTFGISDSSTGYVYDTKTVSASCTTGTTWNWGTGRCEYDAIASISSSAINISRDGNPTLTWSSTHANSCTPGGAWTNSGTLNGNGPAGSLTSSQTYTFQCFGLGSPSPVMTVTVNVCPLSAPTWNGTACVPPTGTLTASSLNCIIPAGQSTCNVNLTWSTTNPYGVSAITRNNPSGTLFTANNGTNQGVNVSGAYPNVTYYLYNNAMELDNVTITPSCAVGTSWIVGRGTCEYDVLASLSANPTLISYNDDSTLTWGSTYATNCTPGGAWTNSGTLNGSTSTGKLTSNQTYTFQCFGLGLPSPVRTATVVTGTADNPILNKNDTTFQPYPTAITTFTGQFTPNGKIVVTGTNVDTCHVTRRIGTVTNTISGPSPLTVNFSAFGTTSGGPLNGRPLEGTYSSYCGYTDGNGTVWTSLFPFSIAYSPIPPKPIVTLRASPSNISAGSQSVLTWKVTYPNSVQVPSQPACTLTATPVCPSGTCTASQLLASTTINNTLRTDNTDANDPNGSRKITSTTLNEIIPIYNSVINDGNTDWEAHGKKTFIFNHSMDFMLRCGSGVNESQGARVVVQGSVEG